MANKWFGKFNKSGTLEELSINASERFNTRYGAGLNFRRVEDFSFWTIMKNIGIGMLELLKSIAEPLFYISLFGSRESSENVNDAVYFALLLPLLVGIILLFCNIVFFVSMIALGFVSALLASIIHALDSILVNWNNFCYYAIATPFIILHKIISEILFFLHALMVNKSENNSKFYLYATLLLVTASTLAILSASSIIRLSTAALYTIYCVSIAVVLSTIMKYTAELNQNYINPIEIMNIIVLSVSTLAMMMFIFAPIIAPTESIAITTATYPYLIPIILSIISVCVGLAFITSYNSKRNNFAYKQYQQPFTAHEPLKQKRTNHLNGSYAAPPPSYEQAMMSRP